MNVNTIIVSKVTTMATGTWIAEGSAAAMVQPVLGAAVIGPPRKLLFGAACTTELERYTAETATTIIQRTVVDAANLAVDAALLDTTAGDTTRPTGLLNGVSDLGATAGGGLSAIVADLAKIAGARDREALSAVTGLLSLLQMMGEYLPMAKRAALCSQLRDAADELERVLVVRVD
jgi:hypothetical protein